MSEYILEMRNITKIFPGVKALDQVNIRVKKGEIHALVGENGAGKSTLMKVLSGVYPYGTYEGGIVYNGAVMRFHSIKDSEDRGIVIIHQELALSPYLSIAENIFMGHEISRYGKLDKIEMLRKAKALMETVDLAESPNQKILNLGVGKQQLVEICKALNKKVELLILDEPTAALNDEDSQKLLDLLLQFKEQGITCIMISHKLKEVTRVADSVTVIRDGQSIETIDVAREGISEDRIIRSMVGRELTNRFPPKDNVIKDILFEVRDWCVEHPQQAGRNVCDNISINVRKGEVVGIAGLMGAGRTEFAMSIFGHSYGRFLSGKTLLEGREIRMSNPKEAIQCGVAYVSEDRKQYGLILMYDIVNNTSMAALDSVSRHGRIDKTAEFKAAMEYRDKLRLRTPGVFQKVQNLSGGNQQKVVLAKWLMTNPKLLILDEPTRGIDVGAKYEIYQTINEIAREGRGILIISSELEELLGTCDRIYVLNEGRICGELKGGEASQNAIMSCIIKGG